MRKLETCEKDKVRKLIYCPVGSEDRKNTVSFSFLASSKRKKFLRFSSSPTLGRQGSCTEKKCWTQTPKVRCE